MNGLNCTPGPWVVVDNGCFLEVNVSSEAGGQNVGRFDPSIAHVLDNTHYEHTAGRAKENACLIAAGHDLYHALEECLIDLAGYQANARSAAKDDDAWEGVAELIQPRIDAGRAALAKARGELEKEAQQ